MQQIKTCKSSERLQTLDNVISVLVAWSDHATADP